ncbi:UNVERIFIED_CONTAM: hypothetical protein K2H54_040249, partial [Gekko kuhli]
MHLNARVGLSRCSPTRSLSPRSVPTPRRGVKRSSALRAARGVPQGKRTLFPPQPAMDPESSGGILPAQTGPWQPQLLADAGMSPSKPDPLKRFYKGEPLALGITQILIGILLMAFGIMINFIGGPYRPPYTQLRIPCWTGSLFIVSGSLSVAAARNPKIPLVKGMLGVNVVSAVAAGIGLLFFATSMDEYLPWFHGWDHDCSDLNLEMYKLCYEANVITWRSFLYPFPVQSFICVVLPNQDGQVHSCVVQFNV